jgi:hypothetical protein
MWPVELGREERRRGLQDLIGPPQIRRVKPHMLRDNKLDPSKRSSLDQTRDGSQMSGPGSRAPYACRMTTVLSLVLSAGAILVAGLAAIYARRQAAAARDQFALSQQIRREATEPYVIVDIAPQAGGTGLLLFSIENSGPTMARDVQLSVTPPLLGGQKAAWDEMLARVVARPIPFMPPGRRIEWAFAMGDTIFGNDSLPRQYTVTVNVMGPSGPVEPLTYLIDLDSINESQIDHTSVETSLLKIVKHTDSLQRTAAKLNTWADYAAKLSSGRAKWAQISDIPMDPLIGGPELAPEREIAGASESSGAIGAVTEEMGGRLTPEESRLMLSLFARYCAYDVDQFDFWRVELPNGADVYVQVTDGAPSDDVCGSFRKVWPLPSKPANSTRSAAVNRDERP